MKSIIKTFFAGLLLAGTSLAASAEDGFVIPGDETFPEGIALASDGTAFVGSIREGEIYRHAPGAAAAEPFIAPGSNGLVSAIGLFLDEEAGTLWVCSSDPGVGKLTGGAAPALLAFDAESGAARGRYELPGGGFCNDMSKGDDGALYVTDSFAPRILRLLPDAQAFEVWFEDDRFQTGGFGLNGLDFTDANTLFVVTYHNAKLFRLDLDEGRAVTAVTEISTDRPLALGDGMKALGADRLLLVEGSGALTMLTVRGDTAKTAVVADGFGVPTTVAVRDNQAWLVEGQLDKLFAEDGPKSADLPFRVYTVDLPHFGG